MGSKDAGQLYRAMAPAVLGYLRAERAPDPEDILGEVFLQVARDLGRFRGDDHEVRRWVFAIARNRLIDARRRQARRPQLEEGPVPDVPAAAASDLVDGDLLAALAQLTDEQREVVVLRFVADLSIDEVARITKRKAGAVKAMQHRGISQLARILGDPDGAYRGDDT
jgi:RNA polymerase sigma-70 factor (ECF subfamily)